MSRFEFSPESLFASVINGSLNRYLRLDPGSQVRLVELGSVRIGIELVGLSIQICVCVQDGKVWLERRFDEEPQVWIRGRPAALAALMKSGRSTNGGISIEGDADLASRFRHALAADVDWEEILSKYTGDAVAHQAGRSARSFLDWLSETRRSMEINLSEYLQEEIRVLPTRYEIDDFLSAVDELRSDSDRLAARVARREAQSR